MREGDVPIKAERSADLRSSVRIAAVLSILLLLLTATIHRNAAVWNDEVAFWTEAAAKSPRKSRVHYNLGKSLYRAGVLAAAETSLLHAAELTEPPSLTADVFCSLGEVYVAQGKHEQAVSAYLQVLEITDSNVVALNNLGLLLLQAGNSIEAESLFRRAILLDPKFSKSYLNLGQSLAAQGKHAEAESYFSAAKSLGFYKITP